MDQRKKCGVEIDMLSSLPDELLERILSLLPLKASASTSILSRRWLHLWKHTTKLIFTNFKQAAEYVKSVNSVFKLQPQKTLLPPSLQEITFHFLATKKDLHEVAKWLDFAFSRRVERLDLNFCGLLIRFRDALRLEAIIAQLAPTTTGTMRFLRVLFLEETLIEGADVRFFLGKCPLLEELVIRRAYIGSDLELVGPSLKKLDLRRSKLTIWKKFSVKVSAPNLTHITIDYDEKNRVFLENVPKLVSMNFGCRERATMHNFAAAASQLKALTICMLFHRKEPFWVPEMPNLKRLTVYDRCHFPSSRKIPFPVTSFLMASPCLQEFEIQITKLVLEEGIGDVFQQHASLKRFKMWWSCGGGWPPCDNHIKVVRYVVSNCVGLEEIEIGQCGDDAKKWRKWFYVVVDNYDSVHAATKEERASFENTTQMQLPARIKLRIANHSHKSG